MLHFEKADSTERLRFAYDLLRELRTDLTENEFYRLHELARAHNGYEILLALDDGTPVALAGFRVLHDFVHGTHLYVDDLVVRSDRRSSGYGALLLRHLEKVASEKRCVLLRLSTGTANDGGRRFYERENWTLRAVVYKKPLL